MNWFKKDYIEYVKLGLKVKKSNKYIIKFIEAMSCEDYFLQYNPYDKKYYFAVGSNGCLWKDKYVCDTQEELDTYIGNLFYKDKIREQKLKKLGI